MNRIATVDAKGFTPEEKEKIEKKKKQTAEKKKYKNLKLKLFQYADLYSNVSEIDLKKKEEATETLISVYKMKFSSAKFIDRERYLEELSGKMIRLNKSLEVSADKYFDINILNQFRQKMIADFVAINIDNLSQKIEKVLTPKGLEKRKLKQTEKQNHFNRHKEGLQKRILSTIEVLQRFKYDLSEFYEYEKEFGDNPQKNRNYPDEFKKLLMSLKNSNIVQKDAVKYEGLNLNQFSQKIDSYLDVSMAPDYKDDFNESLILDLMRQEKEAAVSLANIAFDEELVDFSAEERMVAKVCGVKKLDNARYELVEKIKKINDLINRIKQNTTDNFSTSLLVLKDICKNDLFKNMSAIDRLRLIESELKEIQKISA